MWRSSRGTHRISCPSSGTGGLRKRQRNEVQLDAAIRVDVRGAESLLADCDLRSELLPQLPPQPILRAIRLGSILPPGNSQRPLEVDAGLSPGDEVAAVVLDDGRYHDNGHASSLSGLKG